jgi:hypothetical protein
MKFTYIQKDTKGIYVEFDFKLDAKYELGETFQDYKNGKWVLLSDNQVAFCKSHPNASVHEVFNMQLNVIEQPPVKERTLEDAIREKIAEIDRFDNSDAVNGFTINGINWWITAQERAAYNTSVTASELLGKITIELPIAGQFLTLPVATAKVMLAQIQLYADNAAIVTAKHKAAVSALTDITAVDAYDYTVNYPEKVVL